VSTLSFQGSGLLNIGMGLRRFTPLINAFSKKFPQAFDRGNLALFFVLTLARP
jgi:hypothetical protein